MWGENGWPFFILSVLMLGLCSEAAIENGHSTALVIVVWGFEASMLIGYLYLDRRGENAWPLLLANVLCAGFVAPRALGTDGNINYAFVLEVCTFTAMMSVGYVFMEGFLAEVIVDESGIARARKGIIRKTIPWKEVKCITVGKAIGGRAMTIYGKIATVSYAVIVSPRSSVHYGTRFDNSIQDLPRLLDLLDHYIRQYNIPIVDRRGGLEIRRSNLPRP